ncbi:EpsG family protein [Brachybacterium tyrofermentans]|uniref:EpsG family protein n=1 Tax=Brachybacterium tyrofermentans TaxID=47848 RepID=UPI003F926FB0
MTPYFLLAAVVTLLAALSFRVALSYSRPSFAMAGTGRALGITGALPADDISPEASGSPALAVRAARTWTIFDLLAVAALVAFSGLRYQVGTDYPTYELVFDSMNGSDWGRAFEHTTQEYGYTVMMLLIKQFTEDPKALFWVAAVLTVVPVYLGIKRMSTDPGFSVALFVAFEYAASFNALRQCIAGALLFLGWTYLGKMNAVFWVLAVLALSFHLTAILAVVVLLIVRRWRPTLRATVLFLAGAVVAAAAVRVAPALMSFLDVLNPRYGDYLESGQTGIGSYLQIAAYAGMLLLAVNLGRRRVPLTPVESQMAVYLLAAIALMIVGTQAIVLSRLAGYFTTFAIVLLPNRIARMEDRKVVTVLFLIAAGAYFAMDIMNYGEVVPYRTYLER